MLQRNLLKLSIRNWSRKYVTRMPTFTSHNQKNWISNSKWVGLSIFGASFAVGYYFANYTTLFDIIAYYKYDSLDDKVGGNALIKYKANLENRLNKLPVIEKIIGNGYLEVVNKWGDKSSKTSTNISDDLLTPGGIAIPPKFYFNPDKKNLLGIYHLGLKLTGYPFIIHGGILAAVMEDLMKQNLQFMNIDTSNISEINEITIDYKRPTMANQYIIVKTIDFEKLPDNKMKIKVEIFDQTDKNTLVKGQGIFQL